MNRFTSLILGFACAVALATWTVGCGSESKQKTPQPTKANVVYTSALQQGGPGYVDIYEPPAATSSSSFTSSITKNRPAIIAIHGGAWRSGGKYQVAYTAREFAKQGFVVFAPDYSLAPRVQWPAPLVDLHALVRFMRTNADDLGIDPKKIGAWGQSAGGHLATMLALVNDPVVSSTPTSTGSSSSSGGSSSSSSGGSSSSSSGSGGASSPPPLEEIIVTSGRVRCAVDASGPADLTIPNGMAPDEDGILRDFLGARRAELDIARLLDASTTTYARPDASVLILHGTADTFVSIDHAEHLNTALLAKQADVQLIRVYGGQHDASTFHSPEAWATTLDFFDTRLDTGFKGPFLKPRFQ